MLISRESCLVGIQVNLIGEQQRKCGASKAQWNRTAIRGSLYYSIGAKLRSLEILRMGSGQESKAGVESCKLKQGEQ